MRTQNYKSANQQKSQISKAMLLFIIVVSFLSILGLAEAKTKEEISEDFSDEISDKVEGLNEQLKKISDLAVDEDLDILTVKQRGRIANALKRSKNANVKNRRDKGYKDIGKKKKGKSNGPQNSINDSYQADIYMNPVTPGEEEESEYDPNALEDFSAMLDDVSEILLNAQEELQADKDSKINKNNSLMSTQSFLAEADGTEDFAQAYVDLEDDIALSVHTHVTFGVYEALRITAIALHTAYDCCEGPTRQTILGGNTSTAGLPFAVLAGIADVLAEGADILLYHENDILDNRVQDCILEIGREHKKAEGERGSINTKLKEIDGQVVSIQSDATSLGSDVDILVGQMGTMNENINRVETKVDQVDVKVGQVYTKANEIDSKIDTLTQKVDALNAQMNARFDTMTELLNQRFDDIELLLCTPHGSRPKLSK